MLGTHRAGWYGTLSSEHKPNPLMPTTQTHQQIPFDRPAFSATAFAFAHLPSKCLHPNLRLFLGDLQMSIRSFNLSFSHIFTDACSLPFETEQEFLGHAAAVDGRRDAFLVQSL